MTRYSQPRRIIHWTSRPYLLAAKVCATILHEDGVRGKALAARVREIFPAIDLEAGVPVSPSVIAQRGDKGVRYRREHYSSCDDLSAVAEKVRLHLATGKPWRRVIM